MFQMILLLLLSTLVKPSGEFRSSGAPDEPPIELPILLDLAELADGIEIEDLLTDVQTGVIIDLPPSLLGGKHANWLITRSRSFRYLHALKPRRPRGPPLWSISSAPTPRHSCG